MVCLLVRGVGFKLGPAERLTLELEAARYELGSCPQCSNAERFDTMGLYKDPQDI